MTIDSTLPEGNALGLMAVVRRLLRETGRDDEWEGVQARMISGDYQNMCAVVSEVSNGTIEVVNDNE